MSMEFVVRMFFSNGTRVAEAYVMVGINTVNYFGGTVPDSCCSSSQWELVVWIQMFEVKGQS